MKNKIQIKSFLGKILFEFERENNTTKLALEDAKLAGADLRYAKLEDADLRYADLRYADLRYAHLEGAHLEGAHLEGADLPMFCKWKINMHDGKIKIGCKEMLIEEWDEFFNSNKEFETKRENYEFKRIQACYLAFKTYYEFLESN